MAPQTPRLQTFDLVDEFLVFLLNFSIDSIYNKINRNNAAVAATNSAPVQKPFISLFLDLGGGTRSQPSISVPRQSKTVNGKVSAGWAAA